MRPSNVLIPQTHESERLRCISEADFDKYVKSEQQKKQSDGYHVKGYAVQQSRGATVIESEFNRQYDISNQLLGSGTFSKVRRCTHKETLA